MAQAQALRLGFQLGIGCGLGIGLLVWSVVSALLYFF